METTFSLSPAPSIPLIVFPPGGQGPAELALTVGDLNADGVPDLVVSNELAFLRVYFLQRDPVTGDLSVAGHSTIFPYDGMCPGDNRILTTVGFYPTRPIIYDIDLDGLNDLVYLDHIPPSRAGLQVYEWNLATQMFDRHVPAGSLIDLDSPSMSTGGRPYFGASCTSPKQIERAFGFRIANLRGRAFPQDIVVWSDLPILRPFKAFAYDSVGTPRITHLFNHEDPHRPNILSDNGGPGHNARVCDVDYDGLEEIIAQHVVKWTALSSSPNDEIMWGMVLRTNESELCRTTVNHQLDIHPDNIRGLDFIRTYVDKNGRVYPAPGIEILASPQAGGSNESADSSGPFIYRGITGHMLDQGAEARVWPRKVINLAETTDGDRYWFPSKQGNSPPWKEPSSSGSNPSNWQTLGSLLNGGITGDPNVQDIIPGDFLYDPSGVGGADIRPGPELLVQFKQHLTGWPQCPCDLRSRTHGLMDSSNSLAFVAWGESGPDVNHGPEDDVQSIDIVGSRDGIEVLSVLGLLCCYQRPPGPQCCQPPYTPIKAHLFTFAKDTTIAPRSYKAVSLWSTNLWPAGGRLTGLATGDVFRDSREEILYLPEVYTTAPAPITSVAIVYDSAEVQRPEPTPFAFLDYRRRTHYAPYRDALDYRPFSGLRFYTQRLLPGQTGAAYGVLQDPALGTGTTKGCAVWAEGGTPPYTIDIVAGTLPGGLTSSKLRTGIAPYGQMLFVSGTPGECATRRLRLRVTDSSTPTPKVHEQDFWIAVAAGGPPCVPDTAPSIVRGGFESVFFRVGQPSDLVVHAKVIDENNDAACVKLFDQFGFYWGALLDDGNPNNGDVAAGDGIFSAKYPGLPFPFPFVLHFTMIALDATNQQSLPWPYLIADGGKGDQAPPFHPPANLGSQTATNTPVVTEVEFAPASLPAAETLDADGVVPLTVMLDRKGMNVLQIKVRICHPLTTYKYEQVLNVPAGQQQQSQYALTLNSTANLPTLPKGQFGWGYYTLNVQACVQHPQTGVQYVSDWWPRLRIHP